MKKEQSLKAQWKAETDFINGLVKKYPNVKWRDGSPEISDCPTGWRPIVEDLFAELNDLAYNGISYYNDSWTKRLTDSCNCVLSKLRVPRKFHFRERFSNHTAVKPGLVVKQLKEKFATLTLYYSCDDPRGRDRIEGMLSLAERVCSHTCQVSGARGKLRTNGWYVVLSDEEYTKLNKKKYGKA